MFFIPSNDSVNIDFCLSLHKKNLNKTVSGLSSVYILMLGARRANLDALNIVGILYEQFATK